MLFTVLSHQHTKPTTRGHTNTEFLLVNHRRALTSFSLFVLPPLFRITLLHSHSPHSSVLCLCAFPEALHTLCQQLYLASDILPMNWIGQWALKRFHHRGLRLSLSASLLFPIPSSWAEVSDPCSGHYRASYGTHVLWELTQDLPLGSKQHLGSTSTAGQGWPLLSSRNTSLLGSGLPGIWQTSHVWRLLSRAPAHSTSCLEVASERSSSLFSLCQQTFVLLKKLTSF